MDSGMSGLVQTANHTVPGTIDNSTSMIDQRRALEILQMTGSSGSSQAKSALAEVLHMTGGSGSSRTKNSYDSALMQTPQPRQISKTPPSGAGPLPLTSSDDSVGKTHTDSSFYVFTSDGSDV
jgi:hypothetical protein